GWWLVVTASARARYSLPESPRSMSQTSPMIRLASVLPSARSARAAAAAASNCLRTRTNTRAGRSAAGPAVSSSPIMRRAVKAGKPVTRTVSRGATSAGGGEVSVMGAQGVPDLVDLALGGGEIATVVDDVVGDGDLVGERQLGGDPR